MYLGRIMEAGAAEHVFEPPWHPYTEALLSAAPTIDGARRRQRIVLSGEPPSALAPPSGCPFHTRCHRKLGAICETERPPERMSQDGHRIVCHISLAELARSQATSIARDGVPTTNKVDSTAGLSVMAGEGPPSTTSLIASGKDVDADPSLRLGQALGRHDGGATPGGSLSAAPGITPQQAG